MRRFHTSFAAALVCTVLAVPTQAADYTWNNSGTDFALAASWSPTPPPPGTLLAGDTTQLNVLNTFGVGTINNPSIPGSNPQVLQTTINTNALFQGWTFAGGGTLVLGGSGSTGLTVNGGAAVTLNGPNVVGASGSALLAINVGTSSSLVVAGNSRFASDQGATTLRGGSLTFDNAVTNQTDRFGDSAAISSLGGSLFLRGRSTGSTETVGGLTANAGATTVGVVHTSGSAPTVLTLSSLTRNVPGTVNFTNTGGTLGSAGNNPRIMITGGAAGFIGPWATVNGSELAVYNTTNGVRAAVSGAGGDYAQTYTTAIGTNLTAGQYGAIDQDAGTPNLTWTGSAGAGTGAFLRIKPGAAGQSLTFALSPGENINLNSIVLAGSQDYTINRDISNGNTAMRLTGSGLGARSIGVLDANTTLTFDVPIGGATFDIVKFGDGFLDLTADMSGSDFIGGNALQTRMYLNGGVTRVAVGATGSLVNGTGQSIYFRGGVLEIANGANGLGAAADFTRTLGTVANRVNWNTNANNTGSGGFSAINSNASVNIGGAGATLTWGVTANFIQDDYALRFGSTQSNATLTWQNPLGLDNGTASAFYKAREISVTRGAGNLDDRTVMTGVVSGSTSTDLLKTGTGVLELRAVNTYRGNTMIQGGTLVVASGASLGDTGSNKTGNVAVGKGATLAGSGTINPDTGKAIFVNPGGTIRAGMPTGSSLADHVGTMTVNSNVTINSTSTDRGRIQFEASRLDTGSALSSKIAIGNGLILNLNPGSGNKFAIDLVATVAIHGLVPMETYTVTLASVGTGGNIRLNGANLPDGVINQTNYVLTSSAYTFDPGYSLAVSSDANGKYLNLTFTPVPETGTVLGITAGALGLGMLIRRRLGGTLVA